MVEEEAGTLRKKNIVAALCCLAALASPLCGAAQPAPPLSLKAIFEPRYQPWIRSHPDEFSWMIFALISGKAPQKDQSRLDTKGWTNNAIWETWADDKATFPNPPDRRPVWKQTADKHFKQLGKDPLIEMIGQGELDVASAHMMTTAASSRAPFIPVNGSGEEVRRNHAAFQSIVDRGLWYGEGEQRWFRKHPSALKFIRGSIEVKAVWEPVNGTEKQSSPYHVNYLKDGTPYKLVSLHVSTNALPQWTWATWEWQDNEIRCQQTGCKDAFGSDPPFVSPVEGQFPSYPPGDLQPRLKTLFNRLCRGDKSRPCLKNEWMGYRLKGSQILREGQPDPALLGNSHMEAGFLSTSSCIGCHARARVTSEGKPDCSLGFIPGTKTGYTDFPASSEGPPFTTSFVWAFTRAYRRKDGMPVCP